MSALTATLSQHGVRAEKDRVEGKLTAGLYEIDASVSSQFVSGLLMALPLLDGDSELHLRGTVVSAPYIGITLEVLAAAGIFVEKTAQYNMLKIKKMC